MAPAKGRGLSRQHKAAMAEGRSQSRVVGRYLEALETHKPKRGRKRTPESMNAKLAEIDTRMTDASPIKRLELIQERLDINRALAAVEEAFDISGIEEEFVGVAAVYSASKGISYSAWREIGVPAAVLKRAAISRTS